MSVEACSFRIASTNTRLHLPILKEIPIPLKNNENQINFYALPTLPNLMTNRYFWVIGKILMYVGVLQAE